MSVTLEGGVAWGLDDVEDSEDIWPYVDSYLARYAPDRPELRDAVPPALRLGWVCRALNNPEVSGERAHADPSADVPRRTARVARQATRRARG